MSLSRRKRIRQSEAAAGTSCCLYAKDYWLQIRSLSFKAYEEHKVKHMHKSISCGYGFR